MDQCWARAGARHFNHYEGIGGNSAAVDQCYSGQCGSGGCYCGATALPCGEGDSGCGTIMSYCHLQAGGVDNISFTLGMGHPWGAEPVDSARANLDWAGGGAVSVASCPKGDSAHGCRQMLGNVWEWTSSVFRPYPGFEPDPYADYSAPWFETRRVLRGGCWATRSRLARPTYRNFYEPDRRDVWAGFRTCDL